MCAIVVLTLVSVISLYVNIQLNQKLNALQIRSDRQTKLLQLNNQVNKYNTLILGQALDKMEKESK